jgi:hypothetical protein
VLAYSRVSLRCLHTRRRRGMSRLFFLLLLLLCLCASTGDSRTDMHGTDMHVEGSSDTRGGSDASAQLHSRPSDAASSSATAGNSGHNRTGIKTKLRRLKNKLFYIYELPSNMTDVWPERNVNLSEKSVWKHAFNENEGFGQHYENTSYLKLGNIPRFE